MAYCLVGLGSNLGERASQLDEAVRQLRRVPGLQVVAQSCWYETAPLGGPPDQPAYLNGAVLLETAQTPHALLAELQAIEARLGRRRQERWGPRTLDLDLLLYDEQVLQTAELVVPHPRMAWRRFVLEPAAEIAAEMRHPRIGWTLGRLLAHWHEATNYLALTAATASAATALAERLAVALPARLLRAPGPFPQAEGEKRASTAGPRRLEFLRQSAAILAADDPAWSRLGQTGQSTVSDFWFGQGRAWANATLAAAEREPFLIAWEQLQRTVMPPKLLVVLAGHGAGHPLERAILEEARRVGQGPVLVVDAAEPQHVWAEVLAAAQAIHG